MLSSLTLIDSNLIEKNKEIKSSKRWIVLIYTIIFMFFNFIKIT